jgi:hypothetical protein
MDKASPISDPVLDHIPKVDIRSNLGTRQCTFLQLVFLTHKAILAAPVLTSRQKSMMLLGLPPEILELVLLHLDPGSFSMILMTCKAIRDNVLASSKLLHEKLLRVPGIRFDSPKTNLEILQGFTRRAAYHALNGANVLADAIIYHPSSSSKCSIGIFPFSFPCNLIPSS